MPALYRWSGFGTKRSFASAIVSDQNAALGGRPPGVQPIHFPQYFFVLEKHISVPKIGKVRAKIHRPLEGKPKNLTLPKTKSGRYYAAIQVEVEGITPPQCGAGFFQPGCAFFAGRKGILGHLFEIFFGMVPIDNLDCLGIVTGDQSPYPFGTIPDYGDHLNQRLRAWPFAKIADRIEYKA